MGLSTKAQTIYSQIDPETTRLGDLRKIAKEVKKDHELAMELWSTGDFLPRQLAILIMDKKLMTQELIDVLAEDMQTHNFSERTHLMDWLMANQLLKDKKATALIANWENSPSTLQRRTFWYYQGRLRWTGQVPLDNTPYLLSAVEARIADEEPEVQWAMNFVTGWIGVFDESQRDRCIKVGKDTGLFAEERASKGCTPNYLPEFIRIEVDKRSKK